MNNYKIGLLIFSNNKSDAPVILDSFEKLVKTQSFGMIKSVQIVDREVSRMNEILEDYKNTNLGMIVMVAHEADQFFPYSELEEVGQKNEKYLITLNLDGQLEKNFLKVIQKIKLSSGKPRKGCDSSCR